MAAVIVTENLVKTFGKSRGISDISLDVGAGQVYGFLGPNGAGKSTTIRLLLGLYRPSSGSCRVLGLDPARDQVALLSRVGYLPGELNLFPRFTGREILDRFTHIRRLSSTRVRTELIKRFDVDVDRPVRTLSTGNKQKIGLVLAFMHEPELVVLDEPTRGLDPLLQDEFARLLTETVADGRTVFLSSHDLDEVQRVVHHLAIIEGGQLKITDTIEGLRSRAPRTIELGFAVDRELPDLAHLSGLPGVTVRRLSRNRVELVVTGPVAPVLSEAGRLDAADILARPPNLDELFLRLYTDPTLPATEEWQSDAQ